MGPLFVVDPPLLQAMVRSESSVSRLDPFGILRIEPTTMGLAT